jgi:ERCC4-related helicase
MIPLEPLGQSAKQWQFLSGPEKYVEASTSRKLVLESTRRQFLTVRKILERLNGRRGEQAHSGILLADDVGLGKTAIASLVAWVVASGGEKRGVRILAPNDVVARRWVDELHSQVEPLQRVAVGLDVRKERVKPRRVGRLSAGSIQVVKHSYAASDLKLGCDLLIIDEAHRAKGEATDFSRALKRQRKNARRVLILTATPFSIQLEELMRMLTLVGGEGARVQVRAFSKALDDLYSGNTARDGEEVAKRLAQKAKAAVEALSPFVVRHSVDDLPREQKWFGARADWNVVVPPAKPREVELMIRIDRALRLAKRAGGASLRATNDSRFHVGWRHFDLVREDLKKEVPRIAEPTRALVENQLRVIKQLRSGIQINSKMAAVAEAVNSTILAGEKVVLFCHHHATAQELTVHLASRVPKLEAPNSPHQSVWRAAWQEVLCPSNSDDLHQDELRKTFIAWLCAELIRKQTWRWLPKLSVSKHELIEALRSTSARNDQNEETVAQAAQRLYNALLQSKSSRAVLMEAAEHAELLPGGKDAARVLGVCVPSEAEKEKALFIHNQQPDTVISVFNSPFGPDVLVVTDKLSEGIDLHRYCRHLIHYELDSSPLRTMQRNGRIRRVNSWAAVTGEAIRYAYPALRGTRDYRLVQIMKKRVDSFSLLLGGAQDFNIEEDIGSNEQWRNEVIAKARGQLKGAGAALRVTGKK